MSVGGRFFDVENKVHGFFGFGLGSIRGGLPGSDPGDIQPTEPGEPPAAPAHSCPVGAGWSRNGEWRCPSQEDRKDAPCVNADREVTESDSVYRVNLSWKATDTSLLYATWSEGFRPGGINRNPAVPDYVPDILTNTSWAGSPAGRTTGCNSTAPCSWRSGTTSRWPSRA